MDPDLLAYIPADFREEVLALNPNDRDDASNLGYWAAHAKTERALAALNDEPLEPDVSVRVQAPPACSAADTDETEFATSMFTPSSAYEDECEPLPPMADALPVLSRPIRELIRYEPLQGAKAAAAVDESVGSDPPPSRFYAPPFTMPVVEQITTILNTFAAGECVPKREVEATLHDFGLVYSHGTLVEARKRAGIQTRRVYDGRGGYQEWYRPA